MSKDKLSITITKRSGDYMANLTGTASVWGCGRTPDEAIGNLIWSHYDTFSIPIIHQPDAIPPLGARP